MASIQSILSAVGMSFSSYPAARGRVKAGPSPDYFVKFTDRFREESDLAK
jgi:hypothetical protein